MDLSKCKLICRSRTNLSKKQKDYKYWESSTSDSNLPERFDLGLSPVKIGGSKSVLKFNDQMIKNFSKRLEKIKAPNSEIWSSNRDLKRNSLERGLDETKIGYSNFRISQLPSFEKLKILIQPLKSRVISTLNYNLSQQRSISLGNGYLESDKDKSFQKKSKSIIQNIKFNVPRKSIFLKNKHPDFTSKIDMIEPFIKKVLIRNLKKIENINVNPIKICYTISKFS